jgi:hypothetical protein
MSPACDREQEPEHLARSAFAPGIYSPLADNAVCESTTPAGRSDDAAVCRCQRLSPKRSPVGKSVARGKQFAGAADRRDLDPAPRVPGGLLVDRA